MSQFLAPNLGAAGRWVRGAGGLVLMVGAVFCYDVSGWLALVLALSGLSGVFGAVRGWCLLRACGFKTPW